MITCDQDNTTKNLHWCDRCGITLGFDKVLEKE
jgi:hypothetical protein